MNSDSIIPNIPSVPQGLENVDWYQPTAAEVRALADHRKFIPDQVYPHVQGWMNSYTADFIPTRQLPGQPCEFLLTRRAEDPWKGQFFVAGGRIRWPETPTEACIRNVLRELGFSPSPDQVRSVGFVPCLNPQSQVGKIPWFSTWCLHHVALPDGVEVKLDRTATELKWFSAIQPDFPEVVKIGIRMIGGFPEAAS